MKIVLATGIYPPSIGGPATYVRRVAEGLTAAGEEVVVVTFAPRVALAASPWRVVTVPMGGGFPLRWMRYARALRREAKGASIVYAFSAVSVGMPLLFARLRGVKKILRLGGDFPWERFTDFRGKKTLQEWYAARPPVIGLYGGILRRFDHIVFSTVFQEQLYKRAFRRLPPCSVIENALPTGELLLHARHEPFRLLFLGRFVRFKNLRSLLLSVATLPHVSLTLAGEGVLSKELSQLAQTLRLKGRVTFLPPVAGEEKERVFREHDLLILPSLTEISPHTALEARASGLPVLLTEQTGLAEGMSEGMVLAPLRTVEQITRAILEAEHTYDAVAQQASSPFRRRTWDDVTADNRSLFSQLV